MSDQGEGESSARARLGVGAAIVLLLAGLGITVGIGIWRTAATPVEIVAESPAVVTEAPGVGVDEAGTDIYVHVSGAVSRPGLFVLEDGARVVDAIAAAGGLSDEAGTVAVNLARAVSDGEQLHVPAEGEEPPPAAPDAQVPAEETTVDVNTADASTLETLPGIGPALAQRIVTWREAEGGFASVDDLLAVSGIGPKVLEGMRDRVRV